MQDNLNDLLKQGYQARREDRPDDARRAFIEAVDLCRRTARRTELAAALKGLGQIERDLNNLEVARTHYEEALAIHRVEDDAIAIAHTVRHVGDVLQDQGHLELAEPCYEEALDLYRSDTQTGPMDLANAIRGLAILKENTGQAEQAKSLWEEANGLYAAANVAAGVAESSSRLAKLKATS